MAKFAASKAKSKKTAPAKAGVMLFEDTPEGRKLLVAYNEGRFTKNGRFLVLPKGSIDDGEKPLIAALREFGEETGFHLMDVPEKHIEGFLTHEQVAALERGEVLEHITNPKFPEFSIERFDPHAFTHRYHARSGSVHGMVMYGVEVKGLDTIASSLKNSSGKPTKEFLDEQREIPRFPTFFTWLKQGYIPADGKLPRVELCAPEWIAAKEKRYCPAGIEVAGETKPDWDKTRVNWQRFCHKMEGDDDYKNLRDSFHKIKLRMKEKGFVQGDMAALKFDEKDCPLFWYTEGATIDYARPIIAKTLGDMEDNHDYARAFGGEGTKFTDLRSGQKMALGQVAAYKDFVAREVWLGACLDAGVSRKKVGHILYNQGRLVAGAMQAQAQASDQTVEPESRRSAQR